MMTKRHITILALGIVIVASAVTVAVRGQDDRLRAKARRAWKDQAIATVERRLADQEALESEIRQVRETAATTRPASDAWIGEGVLVMKNGDWIACESICSKEDARIDDLFIGRGSDGKWYYSTFHFCVGMTVLRHLEEWQPDSLAQFAKAYWLAPFDGKSDECLKATWTGSQPWGQDRATTSATPFNR